MSYKTPLTVQINLICTVMYRAVLARGLAYRGEGWELAAVLATHGVDEAPAGGDEVVVVWHV